MPVCAYAAPSIPGGETRVPAGTRILRLPAAMRSAVAAWPRLADSHHHGCKGCDQTGLRRLCQCWRSLSMQLLLACLCCFVWQAAVVAVQDASRAKYFVSRRPSLLQL